jgi:hypothetical protein
VVVPAMCAMASLMDSESRAVAGRCKGAVSVDATRRRAGPVEEALSYQGLNPSILRPEHVQRTPSQQAMLLSLPHPHRVLDRTAMAWSVDHG